MKAENPPISLGNPVSPCANARGRLPEKMISLKKYMELPSKPLIAKCEQGELLPAALGAYGSALVEMGNCSVVACPGVGEELKQSLFEVQSTLSTELDGSTLEAAEAAVRQLLEDWGRRTSGHYREKAQEVKEILLSMARTTESVGARDQRCAVQIDAVTTRLQAIASLDDLSEIRSSIRKSAVELKSSIDRLNAEGKAILDDLRKQVVTYQKKLEEAEEVASGDPLTGLRSRLCVEGRIENRMGLEGPFCLAMVDIDGFKKVNDEHGHLTGDELLKQFASELKSACRSTDVIGRWGGDEFVILLDCGLAEATERVERLSKWVCGDYTVQSPAGVKKLKMDASIGLAEYEKGEPMKALMARADAAMYQRKGSGGRAAGR